MVIKVTSFLETEFLTQGVKQLLEQRLPDARVINSFPAFQTIMDRMLHESLLTVTAKEINIEVIPALTPVKIPYPDIQETKAAALALADALVEAEAQVKIHAQALAELVAQVDALTVTEKQARADALGFAAALDHSETQAKADALTFADTLAHTDAQEKANALLLTDALAKVNALTQAQKDTNAHALKTTQALARAEMLAKMNARVLVETLAQADTQEKADAQSLTDALAKVEALTQAAKKEKADAKLEAVAALERDALINRPALAISVHAKDSQVFHPSQDGKQSNIIKSVLNNIFPKFTISWNKHLMDATFLAQVSDILICVYDPQNPCDVKKYHNDGWKVLVCSTEDLTFPRRLERNIRQIKRSSFTQA